jgi:hypothetical protein
VARRRHRSVTRLATSVAFMLAVLLAGAGCRTEPPAKRDEGTVTTPRKPPATPPLDRY